MSSSDSRSFPRHDGRGWNTRCIHAGEPRPRYGEAITLPVFQSSTFEYTGESSYHDLRYIRLNNTPNHRALHAKLAALEGTEAALVTASGMAAISTALLSVLKPGDHVLVQRTVYGGTHDFLGQDLARLGIEQTRVDAADPSSWEAARRPNTRAFYVEALSNPLLTVPALDQVPRFARDHGMATLIDNTFASPIFLRPAALGFDLVLHSATKYLNGHGDIVAGAILGSNERIETCTHLLNHTGGTLDPHACFLLHRGIKTLPLRMRQHHETTSALAGFLAEHPKVQTVHHPALPHHPSHDVAKQWFQGFGGVLSFELEGDAARADRVLERLELPAIAPSLGSTETLIGRPATTSHRGLDPEERRSLGIADALIRVAVGLEDSDDLIADFEQALAD